jgi:hypothetical protein
MELSRGTLGRAVRAAAIFAGACGLVIAGGTAAFAEDYPPPTPNSLLAQGAGSVCVGAAAHLSYEVSGVNAAELEPNPLTITWVNDEGGQSVVMAGLPLTGRALWPGVLLDSAGTVTDWPGWELKNGVWVESNDGFAWVRPGVRVEFSVAGSQVATEVAYPAATTACANPPGVPRTEPLGNPATQAQLAFTGPEVAAPLASAGGLVLLGTGVVLVARRRRGIRKRQSAL